MQRIEAFLSENEVPDWATSLGQELRTPSTRTKELGFSDATFEWETRSDDSSDTAPRFQLGPLCIKFPLGALSVISGATGSGKSALLEALLGGKSKQCISNATL